MRVLQVRVAVIERAAVVGAHQEQPHGLGVELFQDLADGEEVAQAFGHFFVVHADKAVVHPDMRRRLAAGTLALGDFVLMVRELQVCTATVDIEGFAQSGATHGRALNMPTRAAGAEVMAQRGTVPDRIGRFTGFGGLP